VSLCSCLTVSFPKFGFSVCLRQHTFHQLPERIEPKWFGQDRARCQLGWPLFLLERGSAAHQNDATQQPRPAPHNGQEKRISCHLRQAKIEQNEIEARLIQQLIG